MNAKTTITKSLLFILIIYLFLPHAALGVSAESAALDKVVILETVGDYDETEAALMRDRIAKLHPAFLNVLAEKEIVIKLINFPLTDLEEYAYLKGEIPRGWEHTGYTWDNVPGAGGDPTVARIGYSEPKPENLHDSLNLELHEIAHAVDQFVFEDISYGDAFTAIHQAERPNYLPDEYFEYKEEYFAEAFAFYYLNEETAAELKERAPKTYAFIEKLPKNIPHTAPPNLILNGDDTVEINMDEPYEEEGAIALDDIYGDLSSQIEVTGYVDSTLYGEYEVTYQVENEAGESVTATRMVTVVRAKISDFAEHRKDTVNYAANSVGKLQKAS